MKTAALIVAAGLSSRMGAFKPMLQIGSESIIHRIISTFRQAGVTQIVIVTGHQADALEAHLANCDVTLLQNERYAQTQMFDSVKIGLEYLKDRCDRVFFTPVDVPLFTMETVRSLMVAEGSLIFPSFQNRRGHPISIDQSLISGILADSGEGGLKGALSRSGAAATYVLSEDPGILKDADTPEAFSELLDLHRSRQENNT